MDISAPTKKDLMVPAPFALETSQYSSNSALDTEAFLDPSAACVKPPRRRPPSFIPHTSMDTLMPNTSAVIKPLSHYDTFTHTSTPLDMANTADCCPNTAPMMKEEERRKGFSVGRTQNTFNRHVTFCKRRNGLFRKARELSGLCDAEVAAIVFSPSGKLSEFASSSLSHIIKRYRSFQPQMLPNDLLLQDVELSVT